MKTFIIALVVLVLVSGFVIWNAWDLTRTLDTLLSLTEALPFESADFKETPETGAHIHELYRLWDKSFDRIAMVSGYENLSRADEAIGSLFIHYENGNAADFTHARLMAWDSLKRLRHLESFGLGSIF